MPLLPNRRFLIGETVGPYFRQLLSVVKSDCVYMDFFN